MVPEIICINEKKEMTSLKISIIVPTHGSPQYLEDCIQALLQECLTKDVEIIIVDNHPNGSIEKIISGINCTNQTKLHYVKETDIGLHNARHAGAKNASGNILIFIDDDVIVAKGWLKELTGCFSQKNVDIVGCRIVGSFEESEPEWFKKKFPSGYLSLLDLGKSRILPGDSSNYGEEVYGCCIAMSKKVFWATGGFNPDAFFDRKLIWLRGDGESGIQYKAKCLGFKVYYCNETYVVHKIPAKRLSMESMAWRGFTFGISRSYWDMRTKRKVNESIFVLLPALPVYICQLSLNIIKYILCRNEGEKIWYKTQYKYWMGAIHHHIKCIFSKDLREHVFQKTYLQDKI